MDASGSADAARPGDEQLVDAMSGAEARHLGLPGATR